MTLFYFQFKAVLFSKVSLMHTIQTLKKKMTTDFIQKISLLRESSFVERGHFTALPGVCKEK